MASDNKYSTWNDFREYVLYPALWENLDRVFPEMEFRMVNGYWRSSKHIDGSDSHSADQTFVHYNRKHLIKDNSGERAYSLIDFEMMRAHCDYVTALKRLSAACDLTLPEVHSEEFESYQRLQDARELANSLFVKALWSGSNEANEVLDYMRARHWTDDEIRRAELGYVDTTLLNSLENSQEYRFKMPSGDEIGVSHRLTIPYRNGSRLLGIKFRNIHYQKGVIGENGKEGVKYINSKNLSKSNGFFGMTFFKKDAIVVEGELDALHAQVKGLTNIIATTGNAAGENQIADAVKRGTTRFTLLFDNDERGQSFIETSINNIYKVGGEVHIATLPADSKDVDEFLATHTIDDLKNIISCSVPVCLWRFFRTIERFRTQARQGGGYTSKEREDFFQEVQQIVNAPTTKPLDRNLVYSQLEDVAEELRLDVADFKEWADQEYTRKLAYKRSVETKAAASQISSLLGENRVDEALGLMRDTANEQLSKENENGFAEAFAPISYVSFDEYISAVKPGLPTGFTFKQGHHEEKLTLNAGLTFICGARGHGKTSFLNNIAINEATRNIHMNNGKSVLYFSYEIDKRRLLADLLSVLVGIPLNSGSLATTLLHYFKHQGEEKYRYLAYRGGHDRMDNTNITYREFLDNKVDIFKRNYIANGALVVVDENYTVEKLLQAIRAYMKYHEVSLVCIDYAQLIYSEEKSRLRTEEIKHIVNDIKDFANHTGIPFAIAAQFNREIDSPLDVDTKNIGEAGDIERIADTCIGIYNLKEFRSKPKLGKMVEDEACRLVGSLLGEPLVQPRPFENKLFVRLLKRRYGYAPIDTILDWDGRTKYIVPNDPEQLNVEPSMGRLF